MVAPWERPVVATVAFESVRLPLLTWMALAAVPLVLIRGPEPVTVPVVPTSSPPAEALLLCRTMGPVLASKTRLPLPLTVMAVPAPMMFVSPTTVRLPELTVCGPRLPGPMSWARAWVVARNPPGRVRRAKPARR